MRSAFSCFCISESLLSARRSVKLFTLGGVFCKCALPAGPDPGRGRFSETSSARSPLSIPSKTLAGDLLTGGAVFVLTGDTGTCTSSASLGRFVLGDPRRESGSVFWLEPEPTKSVAARLSFACCSFLSFSLASIACNFNFNVSSSSSS